MNAALNDPYLVLLVLFCAAVITIGSIVTALHRLPRAAFAQLRTELKELSGRVRELEAAEQRRFIRELNSRHCMALIAIGCPHCLHSGYTSSLPQVLRCSACGAARLFRKGNLTIRAHQDDPVSQSKPRRRPRKQARSPKGIPRNRVLVPRIPATKAV